MIRKTFNTVFVFLLLAFTQLAIGQEKGKRWQITSPQSIAWDASKGSELPYADNIEMAGKRVAAIVSYEIDTAGILTLSRQVFFPQIHPQIKSDDPSWYIYRAYSKESYGDEVKPRIYSNGKQLVPGPLKKATIAGILSFDHKPTAEGIAFSRRFYLSSSERLFVEQVTLTNEGAASLSLSGINHEVLSGGMEADGQYATKVTSDVFKSTTLAPGKSVSYSIYYSAQKSGEQWPANSAGKALREREEFLSQMSEALILETPNKTLNTLFEFSKIRASESIFESKLGLIHSPGGGRYYVGIWANDQAEYINPFFPFLGYDIGNESAMSTYRAFAAETNDQFEKIRYAFEMEGTVPPFLLDRGDAAMIAYGASQFALALGDETIARELWPLISWCLEYNQRMLNAQGVVKSESDEMEGRIETGDANLSTSSLYYGALTHAADLAKDLGQSRKMVKQYRQQAAALATAIENYFGATVEGLDTYKYYEEHQYLRHWICLPLVVGINERKDATIKALFDRLWTENGVHVEKNSDNEAVTKIFWDRGTLYALRGTFLSGATDVSLEKLEEFSFQRLLGKRVPYVVEAYPEGSMAHLSAESGLYCRVFVEGLFGVCPTGLNSFSMIPRLPSGWDEMALRKIKAFGQDFDIIVKREGEETRITVTDNKTGKALLNRAYTLDRPVNFEFK